MKTIGVITSGGDCQGMNQVLSTLISEAFKRNLKLIFFMNGYAGILQNKTMSFSEVKEKLAAAQDKGGTVLKSSRCLEMKTLEGQKQVVDNLRKHNVDALIVIGGDGSAAGAKVLSEQYQMPAVVIPATIDNDIPDVPYSLGYLSAIDRAKTQISWISDTATSHDRVFIVEVMGRHCGNLALGISQEVNPLATVLPDTEISEELLTKIDQAYQENKTPVVIITELQPEKIQKLQTELSKKYEVRVNSLGHGQRGGAPTKLEKKLAAKLARTAVKNVLKNKLGMVKHVSI
jgi:6-phosphofructokinase 1